MKKKEILEIIYKNGAASHEFDSRLHRLEKRFARLQDDLSVLNDKRYALEERVSALEDKEIPVEENKTKIKIIVDDFFGGVMFVTSDGTRFEKESDAAEHERNFILSNKNIPIIEKVDESLLDEAMRLYRESNGKYDDHKKLKEEIYNKYADLVGNRPVIELAFKMMEEYHKQMMTLICQ